MGVIPGMERWQGKCAVVTGSNAGIGAAISVALATAGMRVVALDKKCDLLKSGSRENGLICTRVCDVSRPTDVALAFQWVEKEMCGVDVLVNNAGVLHDGQITSIGDTPVPEEKLLLTIDTNLSGLVVCTRYACNSMKKRNSDGHIINIASILGHYVPRSPYVNVYPGTKHAITGLTATLANELCYFKSKIKTTNISPGLVQTVLASGLIEAMKVPVLQPRDVSNAVLWAVSTPPHCNITELTLSAVGQPPL